MVRILLMFAVCLPAIAAQTPASSSVVGRWRSLATSHGGIGAIFEFHPDGVVDYSPGAVVESDYRIEGDEVVLPPATKTGPEQRQTVEWLGDEHFRLTLHTT